MKNILIALFLVGSLFVNAQIDNIIIITTDGFRWQEVFKGMDSAIANNPAFNQRDSAEIYKEYWAATPEERRKKLLPFIWSTMSINGQIFGNRLYDNKVDNANPYWFSYPGYSEIFTGFVDTAINSNGYPPNPHTNVLEFLNKQPAYRGRVAAFCAWDAFSRILNKQRSGIVIVNGYDTCCPPKPDAQEKLIDDMKWDSYSPFGGAEALDVFTQYSAMDYLKKHKPRVLYISYGETDDWAHAGHYEDYLNAAHHVDKWLRDIWDFVQSDPQYRNKTAIFITVDHGRGDIVKKEWTSHNNKIADSHQIWFAVMGPGIPEKGEIKAPMQLYQKQYAETFAQLLGLDFSCDHPVATGLKDVLMKK